MLQEWWLVDDCIGDNQVVLVVIFGFIEGSDTDLRVEMPVTLAFIIVIRQELDEDLV